MKENSVTRWFGTAFDQLHPALQQLHRDGGMLKGTVNIRLGASYIARFLGKRLAKKLHIPTDSPTCDFEVQISHPGLSLLWCREFQGTQLCSLFESIGTYPTGYWRESTGAITLLLGVEIKDGGWHWQQRGIRWHGVPLPTGLFPRITAYKCMENEKYRFNVEFSLPKIGLLLSYNGMLNTLRVEENPPWVRFPNVESYTGYWRQGKGEWWMGLWKPYWDSLSSSERLAYLEKYPPNEDWHEKLEIWDTLTQQRKQAKAT